MKLYIYRRRKLTKKEPPSKVVCIHVPYSWLWCCYNCLSTSFVCLFSFFAIFAGWPGCGPRWLRRGPRSWWCSHNVSCAANWRWCYCSLWAHDSSRWYSGNRPASSLSPNFHNWRSLIYSWGGSTSSLQQRLTSKCKVLCLFLFNTKREIINRPKVAPATIM